MTRLRRPWKPLVLVLALLATGVAAAACTDSPGEGDGADGGGGGDAGGCVPASCPVGACGPVADGCGDMLDCGECTDPPLEEGRCGVLPRECGPPVDHGACPTGESCGPDQVCAPVACTHYVSPAGAASWEDCAAEGAPCALDVANGSAGAGDVVCLLPGEYATAIEPIGQGQEGAPLRFVAPSGGVTLGTGGTGILLSQVSHVWVEGVRVEEVFRFFELVDATDCVIAGSTFRDASSYEGGYVSPGSAGNRIVANVFEDAPGALPADDCFATEPDVDTRPGDQLTLWGDRTLVAGNRFGSTSHYAVNVYAVARTAIRGNIVRNTLHAGIGSKTGFEDQGGRLLIDRNLLVDGGKEYCRNPLFASRTKSDWRTDDVPWAKQVSLQIASDFTLVRRNAVLGGGRGMNLVCFQEGGVGNGVGARRARVVHNVFHANLTSLVVTCDTYPDLPLEDATLANNLFSAASQRELHGDTFDAAEVSFLRNGWSPGAAFRYLYGDDPGDRALAAIEASYGSWQDNLSVDPAFTDAAAGDVTLSASSPAIDQGAWLATITSATGTGSTIVVSDPRAFYDGWEIPGELGDLVRTEGGQAARVVAIDYATGELTLDRTISFTQGEGLALDYRGSAPDLGAYERCDSGA